MAQFLLVSFILGMLSPVAVQADLWGEHMVEARELLEHIKDIEGVDQRAITSSSLLVGRAYQLGPAGEGKNGIYDPKPLVNLSHFDCTTFVEVVLSFAFASRDVRDPGESFLEVFKDLKYSDPSQITYVNRNHFISTNWHPNSVQKGYLKDVTLQVFPGAPLREKMLDVGDWYQKKIDRLQSSVDPQGPEKIRELSIPSRNKTPVQHASLYYVPEQDLLREDVQNEIRDRKVLLFNVIRSEEADSGVPVIVVHQGFVVSDLDGTLVARHASSRKSVRKVTDEPFLQYIDRLMADSETVGLNLMEMVESRD